MLQLGQLRLKVGARLLGRPILIGHVLHQKIGQRLQILIGKLPVGIAPLAVVLVERAVRLAAEQRILQRHAAALADQLARRAQQRVDRYVKQRGQELERVRIGHGFAVFPAGNRLTGNKYLFGQLVLRQAVFCAQRQNYILGSHCLSPRV